MRICRTGQSCRLTPLLVAVVVVICDGGAIAPGVTSDLVVSNVHSRAIWVVPAFATGSEGESEGDETEDSNDEEGMKELSWPFSSSFLECLSE